MDARCDDARRRVGIDAEGGESGGGRGTKVARTYATILKYATALEGEEHTRTRGEVDEPCGIGGSPAKDPCSAVTGKRSR